MAVAAPFIYTFPMLTGFDEQVTPADYPREWYEVNEFLEINIRDSQVLFLPNNYIGRRYNLKSALPACPLGVAGIQLHRS